VALRHLAACLAGKGEQVSPSVRDSRFFHYECHGPLEGCQRNAQTNECMMILYTVAGPDTVHIQGNQR